MVKNVRIVGVGILCPLAKPATPKKSVKIVIRTDNQINMLSNSFNSVRLL
jgi:hypothetical protein